MHIRKLLILLFFFLLHGQAHAITETVGAHADATEPNVACAVFGFSVESTITLPTGLNIGRFLRVSDSGNFGMAVVEDANAQTLITFGLDNFQILATRQLTTFPGDFLQAGRVQGHITNGQLFLFRTLRQVASSCVGGAGASCIQVDQINPDTTIIGTGISTDTLGNLDDVRDDGAGGSVIVANFNAGATRDILRLNHTGLTFTLGSNLAVSAFGHIARDDFSVPSTGAWVTLESTANPNGFVVAAGGATTSDTYTTASSLGTRLPQAGYFLNSDGSPSIIQYADESDQTGGIQARRAYVRPSDFVNNATGFYAAGGQDGGAAFQGTFYDRNPGINKVFSNRLTSTDFIRVTPGPSTFTIEERFACPANTCGNTVLADTQVSDYSPSRLRIYQISGDSPARLNKIQVCASGGPP